MRVGFIGIGAMGLPMASNILNSGKKLFVFDIRDAPTQSLTEKGAVRCSSIGSLSEESEIVMMSLPGPEEVRIVASEVLASMSPGKVLVDLSTNSPSLIRELDSMAKLKKISFLDAPVSGGTRGAKSGELTVMVGGEKRVFDTLGSIWDCIGTNVFHVGEAGTGNIIKLVNNMLAFSNMMSNAEALILGAKAGIDPNVLWDIVKTSSGNSATWTGGVKAILKDKLSPNFTVSLAFKDINLAADLAKELGVDLPMGSVTQRLLKEFCQSGFADEDILATIKILEDSSGASIRGQWRD